MTTIHWFIDVAGVIMYFLLVTFAISKVLDVKRARRGRPDREEVIALIRQMIAQEKKPT